MQILPAEYNTIESIVTGSYSESRSKFLAYAYPSHIEEDIKKYKATLKKEHHKAVHVAFGARFGFDNITERFSDDGEPSGTAGRPILHELKFRDVTNLVILVVRYFGGKKLGVPGLINAYRLSAANCLDNASIRTISVREIYLVSCKGKDMALVMQEINKAGAHIIESIFGELCTFKIVFNRGAKEKTLPKLLAIWQMELQFVGTE